MSRSFKRLEGAFFRMSDQKPEGKAVFVTNMWRPSSASEEKALFGPSSDYKSEEWILDYFYVDEDGHLGRNKISAFLPLGYDRAYKLHGDPGRKEGPIYKVRAWGMEFACRYLQFCTEYLKVRDENGKTIQERASWDLQAVGWDLPGYYTIASEEHPFTATSPSGKEYAYDFWSTEEQAITQLREMRSRSVKTSDAKQRRRRN
jgi:hypothetical protein